MARYLAAGGRHVMTAPSALGMFMGMVTPLTINMISQSSRHASPDRLNLLSLWQ